MNVIHLKKKYNKHWVQSMSAVIERGCMARYIYAVFLRIRLLLTGHIGEL